MRLGLGAAQERRADRDRARAKRERGGHSPAVADAARGDDRDTNMTGKSWNEREEPDRLPFRRALLERASMSAGLEPLCDDGIGACRLRLLRFRERRRRREPRDPLRLEALDEPRGEEA